ncbi:MAG: transglutaminase domain-containing protein [Lachnospiraceae bacterium]|nr:transglutaminase domain-containing protein [Lachnospiraceae bacterium]
MKKTAVSPEEYGLGPISLFVRGGGHGSSKLNTFDHILNLICVVLSVFGVHLCFSRAFFFECSDLVVFIAVCAICTSFYVVVRGNIYAKYALASVFVVICLVLVSRFAYCAHYIVSRIGIGYNSYYGLNINTYQEMYFGESEGNLALIMLLFPMCGVTSVFTALEKTMKPVIGILLLYLLGMFLCGSMPDIAYLLLAIIPVMALVSARQLVMYSGARYDVKIDSEAGTGMRARAIITSSLLLTVCAFAGYGLFYPPIEEKLSPIRSIVYNSSVSELFSQLKGGYSAGGINGGDLSRGGTIKFNNDVHLKVVFDDDQNGFTYLKGYVGSVYENGKWNELPETAYSAPEYDMLSGYAAGDILSVTYNRINEYNRQNGAFRLPGIYASTVKVELPSAGAADSKYVCIPYLGLTSDDDGIINDLAYVTRRGEQKENYYSFYSFNMNGGSAQSLPADIVDSALNARTLIKASATENTDAYLLEKAYEGFVNANYLDIPDSCSKIKEEYGRYKLKDVLACVRFVRSRLSLKNYTLSPETTPAGRDTIEYFLYDSDGGYCTHFASAAVIMFRSMGIPARFVQGYIVSPAKAGEIVEVTDTYAHAWPEIYLSGFGWIPVEVTPGYHNEPGGYTPDINQRGQNGNSTETTAAETTTNEETTTQEETTSVERSTEDAGSDDPSESSTKKTKPVLTTADEGTDADPGSKEISTGKGGTSPTETASASADNVISDGDDNGFGPVLMVAFRILVVLFCVAFLYFLLMLNRYLRLRAFKKLVSGRNNRVAVISMFERVERISSRFAFPVDDWSRPDELAEHYSSVRSKAWESFLALSKKAMFSEGKLPSEDKKQVKRVYNRFLREVYTGRNAFEKFVFKYIFGYI